MKQFIHKAKRSLILLLTITALSSVKLWSQDITVIKIADTIDQLVDIQYSSIEISQVVDFDHLIRVYINSKSTILLDGSVAAFENIEKTIYDKLKANIDKQNADLTPESIVNTKNDLKILVRKSVYTSKDDFSTMLESVNNAIWSLMSFYCNEVYSTNYKTLTEQQQGYIRHLVPLENYLANDNLF